MVDYVGWKRVEQPPPEGLRVLVLCNGGDSIGIASYNPSRSLCSSGWLLHYGNGEIVRWAPLPTIEKRKPKPEKGSKVILRVANTWYLGYYLGDCKERLGYSDFDIKGEGVRRLKPAEIIQI